MINRSIWVLVVVACMWLILVFRLTGSPTTVTHDPATAGPTVGQTAPGFTLDDVTGHSVVLARLKGHTMRLAFFCGCDRCRVAATRIGKLQRAGTLGPVMCVIALDRNEAKKFVQQTRIQGVVLTDPGETAMQEYASVFCPRLWVIDRAGRIAYKSQLALEGPKLDGALGAVDRSYDGG